VRDLEQSICKDVFEHKLWRDNVEPEFKVGHQRQKLDRFFLTALNSGFIRASLSARLASPRTTWSNAELVTIPIS